MITKILPVVALVSMSGGLVHASNCRIYETTYGGGIYPFASFVGPLVGDKIDLDLKNLDGQEKLSFAPSGGWIALPGGLKRTFATEDEAYSAEGLVPGQGNIHLKINVNILKRQFASHVIIEGFTSYEGEATQVKDTLRMECK